MDYEKAYKMLFHAMTDAISVLYKSGLVTMELDKGIEILKNAQSKTEDMYLNKE